MDIPSETANRRRIFRVSLAAAGLSIEIDGQPACHLLDAHSEGFAATVPAESANLHLGDVVRVRLTYEGQTWCGRAEVRAVVQCESGTYRCGFATLPGQQSFRRGLRHVAIAVQRQRLSRSATRH